MKSLSKEGYYACDLSPGACVCKQDQREQCRNSRWKSYDTLDREHRERDALAHTPRRLDTAHT